MLVEEELDISSLYLAIQTRNMNSIERIWNHGKESFNYRNQLGETLLHIAVKNNYKELIDWLIDKGFHIDGIDFCNRTVLHLAIATKNEDMVKYLLDHKASMNLKDSYGKSPFHMAIHLGNVQLIDLLLKYGADALDYTLNTHETSFHIALKNEDEKIFNLLMQNCDGELNVRDIYGETLLHLLARQKFKDSAELLLKRGTDLQICNEDNETPLHFAIHNRNFTMTKLFIDYGADVNIRNRYGESPLHLAVRYKEFRLVELLLQNNARIDNSTNDKDSILHIAVNYFNQNILNILLKFDVDIETRNNCDLSPFHLAIKQKCINGAKSLMEKGANINTIAFGKFIRVDQNFTPLHTAIIQKDIDSVEFLLESGVKLDLETNYEMFLAVKTGCIKLVKLFIKYGGNVNAVDKKGQSILFAAMEVRNKEQVEIFLQNDINNNKINETNFENETALHLAVKARDEKFVQFLINIGIDVNICNIDDLTALCYAFDNTNIANSLIAKIALLKINNFFVSKRNEVTISMFQEFDLFFTKCMEELQEIKGTICGDCLLMNFLTNDTYGLSTLVRQKTVVEEIKAIVNKDKYPIYYSQLLDNMNKGLERWKFLKEMKNILSAQVYFEPLYDVLDIIVNNFSNRELKDLIRLFDNDNHC